jgi:hypothetical protein
MGAAATVGGLEWLFRTIRASAVDSLLFEESLLLAGVDYV